MQGGAGRRSRKGEKLRKALNAEARVKQTLQDLRTRIFFYNIDRPKCRTPVQFQRSSSKRERHVNLTILFLRSIFSLVHFFFGKRIKHMLMATRTSCLNYWGLLVLPVTPLPFHLLSDAFNVIGAEMRSFITFTWDPSDLYRASPNPGGCLQSYCITLTQ